MNPKEVAALAAKADQMITRLRGALRLLRPAGLDREAARRFHEIRSTNAAVPLFPQHEQQRMQADLRQADEKAKRQLAGVALHQANEVPAIVQRVRDYAAACRRDVSLTAPDALRGITPDGMLVLELLREQRGARLRQATPAQLLQEYARSATRQDAADALAMQLIEELVASGAPLATEPEQLSDVRQLRELIDLTQGLRVPAGLPDADALERDAARLKARAVALQVMPTNPLQHQEAAQLFAARVGELDAAGEMDDAASVEAARAEAAATEVVA